MRREPVLMRTTRGARCLEHAARALLAAVVAAGFMAAGCAAQIPNEVMTATTSTLPIPWGAPASRPGSAGVAAVDRVLPDEEPPSPDRTLDATSPTNVPATPIPDPGRLPTATTTTVATTIPPGERTSPEANAGAEVRTTLRQEESAEPPYVVEISLPEVVGLDDEVVAVRINEAIARHVADTADPFIADLVEYLTEFPPDPGTVTSSFEMGFEVTLIDGGLLSIRFYESYYTAGAASANGDVSTLIFDLGSGEEIGLDAILRDDEARIPLAEMVTVGLVDGYFEGDQEAFAPWTEGAGPDRLDHVAITPAGLEFGFGQYQVGPGAIGTPIVFVPYERLAELIDPAGPAGRFLP